MALREEEANKITLTNDFSALVAGCWLVSDSAREGPQDRRVYIARAPLPAALVGRREPDPGLPERLRKA